MTTGTSPHSRPHPPAWRTLGAMMMLIAFVAAALASYRFMTTGATEADWMERLILAHVLAIGVLIPLGVLCGLTWFATDRPGDATCRAMTLVVGALALTYALGSLAFWFLIMALGGQAR